MNLTFSVLLFDDDREWVESQEFVRLSDTVAEWGMRLRIDKVHESNEFTSKNYADYDLMVIDFNLGGADKGDSFIRDVRDNNVYTEIIFYSARPVKELRTRVLESELDGVHVASRVEIESKIINVGRHTIRKVLDLENMRGLVMAETGSIDLLLDAIITDGTAALNDEQRRKFFEKFIQRMEEFLEDSKMLLDELAGDHRIESLLDQCDSQKRVDSFMRLAKLLSVDTAEVKKYSEDVLSKRNALAHGIPTHEEDLVVFNHRGKRTEFRESDFLDLRRLLVRYELNFQSIKTKIIAAAPRAAP